MRDLIRKIAEGMLKALRILGVTAGVVAAFILVSEFSWMIVCKTMDFFTKCFGTAFEILLTVIWGAGCLYQMCRPSRCVQEMTELIAMEELYRKQQKVNQEEDVGRNNRQKSVKSRGNEPRTDDGAGI